MLYEVEKEISHQKISSELEWIVAAHDAFTPPQKESDRYIHYIPSLFYPKEAGTGIGGLMLISTYSFSDVTLTKFQTVLESILSKIGVFYLFENFFDTSVRSAIASIMARNMSHNIGSHVIPRATVDAVWRRLQALDLWPDTADRGLALVSALKGNLDEYIQRKSDFLAEITTEPLMATRPAYFYREVIIPFVENTLLMDNIAANEGVRYYDGGRSNRLKIRTFINDKELKAVYKCDSCDADEGKYVYPDELPYSLSCPIHKTMRLRISYIENGDQDLEVELPGPLGEFAIYSFLENYIRNVAKHNKEGLARSEDLVISLAIYDRAQGKFSKARKEKHNSDDTEYYGIRIWNNIIDADQEVNITIENKSYTSLCDALSIHANSKVIQPDGSLKRQAWGIGEMKICAVLLRGPKDFVAAMEEDSLLVLVDRDSNGVARLVYAFKLMKSKRICAVIPWYTETRWRDEIHKSDPPLAAKESYLEQVERLRQSGVWIFTSLDELENDLDKGKSIASFRFALFDCSQNAGKERIKILRALMGQNNGGVEKPRGALLPKFPFRVLAFVGSARFALHPTIKLIPETAHSAGIVSMTAAEMISYLWKHWLGRWLDGDKQASTAVVNIFLDQEANETPSTDWARHAEHFNQRVSEVKVNVFATEGGAVTSINQLPIDDHQKHLFYDRHRGLRDTFQNYLLQNDDWSYLLLEKHSPDFTTLFSPKFPVNSDDIWELPWELAEAGLIRIVVIDERAAEFSMDTLSGAPGDIMYGLMQELSAQALPENLMTRKWHLAWAAKIWICTHFGLDGEPMPLHHRIADMESDFPFFKIKVGSDQISYNYSVAGEQQYSLQADAVLIHQGILDEWRTKIVGFDQKAFLDRLRNYFPFVIVESGRGIPPTLSENEKFLPFSLLQHNVLGENVGKFGLTRVLMSLARRRGRS